MIDPLLQCSLEMRECLAAASKSNILADIVAALFATLALATGNPDFESYFVADLES